MTERWPAAPRSLEALTKIGNMKNLITKRTSATALALLLCGIVSAQDSEIPEIGPDQLAFSVDNMDTSVDPGEDFYRYASGSWQDRMERPADKESIGAIPYQLELVKAQLKAAAAHAANQAADAPKGSPLQQVGDFYQAYMDTEARDAAGMAPLASELERIDAIASLDDLAHYLGGQTFVVGAVPLALLGPIPDLVDNTVYKIYAAAGILGLTKLNKLWLDTYLDEPGSARKTAYAAYIRDVLTIAGHQAESAAEIAEMIVALETDLHAGMLTPTEMADPRNFYNPMTFDEFQALAPEFKLQSYFAGLGIDTPEQIVNTQARYFPNLSKILQSHSLDDLKHYLRFLAINHFAGVLSTDFEAPTRAFREVMTGLAELPPAEERVVDLMRKDLGHPMSKVFVDQFFSDDTKAATLDMIDRIKAVFIARIKTREWLSEETRAEALRKAENLSYVVGYPDTWIDYSSVDIGPDPVGNLIKLSKFSNTRHFSRYGGPVINDPMSNSESTLPMVLNAAYSTSINGFEVTAAIVQPPMFMPEMDAAVNFCRLGAVIGHEMTHGFDSGGRQYDADGNLRDWWTEADAEAFNAEAQKLIEQGDAYEILPGLHTSGALNVKENMADVGGITLAYEALKGYLAEHPEENVEIDGLSPTQRCFIAWAQLWTEELIEQKLRGMVANDFHPPNVYRATAPLRHVDAFYEAFGIEEGDPMWLAPEQRVRAW